MSNRVGYVLGSTFHPTELVSVARAVEENGFSSIWSTEDYFATGGVAGAATVLASTDAIHVGTGTGVGLRATPRPARHGGGHARLGPSRPVHPGRGRRWTGLARPAGTRAPTAARRRPGHHRGPARPVVRRDPDRRARRVHLRRRTPGVPASAAATDPSRRDRSQDDRARRRGVGRPDPVGVQHARVRPHRARHHGGERRSGHPYHDPRVPGARRDRRPRPGPRPGRCSVCSSPTARAAR